MAFQYGGRSAVILQRDQRPEIQQKTISKTLILSLHLFDSHWTTSAPRSAVIGQHRYLQLRLTRSPTLSVRTALEPDGPDISENSENIDRF